MLQDHPGRPSPWFLPFCGNDPLWSLAYEWWFYMLYFPLIKFCSSGWQKVLVFSLEGIRIFFYSLCPNPPCHYPSILPVWWFGVEMAKEYLASGGITLSVQSTYLFLLLVPLVSHLIITIDRHFSGKPLALSPIPFSTLGTLFPL
jgi:peptidoglycan/LPS O-acetylase OafA/YrhL